MRLSTCIAIGTVLLAGCSRESLKDKAKTVTNKAGAVVGEGASTFFVGMGEGIDKTVTSYDVRISDELKTLGVSVTVAKWTNASGEKPHQILTFYILNKAPVTGQLRLKLFNDADQEIGRSVTEVTFAADDAHYVPFELAEEVPVSLAKYVTLDIKAN